MKIILNFKISSSTLGMMWKVRCYRGSHSIRWIFRFLLRTLKLELAHLLHIKHWRISSPTKCLQSNLIDASQMLVNGQALCIFFNNSMHLFNCNFYRGWNFRNVAIFLPFEFRLNSDRPMHVTWRVRVYKRIHIHIHIQSHQMCLYCYIYICI